MNFDDSGINILAGVSVDRALSLHLSANRLHLPLQLVGESLVTLVDLVLY